MKRQARLRAGIAGCGYQGGNLARAIGKTGSMELVACADPDRTAAAQLAAGASHSSVFNSVEDMLGGVDLDVVLVATPHHVLCPVTLAALRAGKHVMAEKPVGLNEREAAQLADTIASAGVCFLAGYSLRSFVAWQMVCNLVRSGAVGEIQAVIGSIGVGPMVEGWIAQPECGGGPLLYVGSHLVDQVLWLLDDDPIEVSADVRTRLDTGAEETAAFQIEFARGATAQCLVTQAAAGFFNNLDIVGREGHIGVRSTGFLDYTIEVMSKTQPAYSHPAVIRPRTAGDRILMMHVPQLEAFATVIREQRQPDVTIAEGRRVLAVLDAVVESGRTGEIKAIS